jgi:hypothetical protein
MKLHPDDPGHILKYILMYVKIPTKLCERTLKRLGNYISWTKFKIGKAKKKKKTIIIHNTETVSIKTNYNSFKL